MTPPPPLSAPGAPLCPRGPCPVVVVLPVKRLALAKSRLALPGPVRSDLALAFALDVAAAAVGLCPAAAPRPSSPGPCAPFAARAVVAVVAVTDDPRVRRSLAALPLHLVDEPPQRTLLAALSAGCAEAHRLRPDATVAVVPADLPALTSGELAQLLREGAEQPAAFVPDASGDGTTVLLLRPGARARPRYGPRSAALHERDGVVRLARAPAGARQDVDTLADLCAARSLGVGTHTSAALDRHDAVLQASADAPLLAVP